MKSKRWLLASLIVLFCAGLGCSASAVEAAPPAASAASDEELADELFDFEEDERSEIRIKDPLEPLNRKFFWFNDKFYFYLLKPVAKGWRVVAPQPVRISLANFLSNLLMPMRAVNCLLQGKIDDFGNEIGRFMVNTTIGIGGLFDPAKKLSGIGPVDEDFGQTLGVWGWGPGVYLVLPFFGPSSIRDMTGIVGDYFLDPLYYTASGIDRTVILLSERSVDFVNAASLDKESYEGLILQSIDPYIFIRNAYVQMRRADIAK